MRFKKRLEESWKDTISKSQATTFDNISSNIEPREAKLYDTLQMADIFIGAIGYEKEGFNTSESKVELCKYIQAKKLEIPSKIRSQKFNVWYWEPR
ncbi:MAG: hypothetical protein HYZ85_01970 [Candidatus Omnitrophica bacterium]|nr:hypothetical protein [Candidatus Omnitrophota bacterium]